MKNISNANQIHFLPQKNMRNKILLAASEKEKELFDSILQEFFEAGGELFFAENKEMAVEILHNEHPQLLFLEALFFDEEKSWKVSGTHLVILSEAPIPELPYLLKPLKAAEIKEKCQSVFGSHQASYPKMPPM